MSKLEDIVHYCFPRAVGHTYAEVNGVKSNPKALLVVAHKNHNTGLTPGQIVTIDELPCKVRGSLRPIVIDHFALQLLVSDMRKEILAEVGKVVDGCPVVLVNISMSGVHGSELYKRAILVDELKAKLGIKESK